MIIQELIKELQEVLEEHKAGQYGDQAEIEIIVALDGEGNGFNTVDDISMVRFDGENIYLVRLDEVLREFGFTEEDCNPDAPVVVCIG